MRRVTATIVLFFVWVAIGLAQPTAKREFRGAWLHVIGQGQYRSMTPLQTQKYLIEQLDELQRQGINAVIFQVRPEADALYFSTLEPWSRHLTGKQGIAPSPLWDPLQFMIIACHERNMELHAWLNPYRVQSNIKESLDPKNTAAQHPEMTVVYGTQRYFDPGLPESRAHINRVVADIVDRYDIDAIHMDDYFYPYPIPGVSFPDEASFARYGKSAGFAENQRDDWRRDNVNRLIKELQQTIKGQKPWVRFGISPFGIYRNAASDPTGSDTHGLQNYDQLYADVTLWAREGWIDYLVPQLYWELGHKAACSETLIEWWSEHANNCPLYIGQDVRRTMDAADINPKRTQLDRKMQLSRLFPTVSGNCFWPGYELTANYKGVGDALCTNYHATPTLVPTYPLIDAKAPDEARSLTATWTPDGYVLTWKAAKTKDPLQEHIYYAVYRFEEKEKIDLNSSDHLVAITRNTLYKLPYRKGDTKYRYVVTAFDRTNNESVKGKTKVVKL